MNTYRSWWRHKTSIYRSFRFYLREGGGGGGGTQTHFSDKNLKYILWNSYQVNTTPHWSLVNNGSGNGLVPSSNKPLHEPMLTQISGAIWHHYMPQWVNLDIANHLLHVVWICPGNGLVPISQQAFNTLRPRQHGRHFPDDIFKCIFLNENVWTSIQISLKFVPKGPIDNIPALVQIMARRRPGDKPLSEPMLIILLTHICVTRPQWVNRTDDDKDKMFKKWLHVYKQ